MQLGVEKESSDAKWRQDMEKVVADGDAKLAELQRTHSSTSLRGRPD